MEVQALTRYARMSPKKVREVARTIQGRKAAEAVDYLTLIPRKSAQLIAKTLKSAVANAEQKALLANEAFDVDLLVVSDAQVDMGSPLKRFAAAAQGRATPIRKPTSHVKIAVTTKGAK